MFEKLSFRDERDKVLRKISVDAKLPLSDDYKKLIDKVIKHLKYIINKK